MERQPHSQAAGFTDIQRKFLEMLDDGRHIFDAASNALLGGTDPEVIREDLFATDKRINKTEQQIRRLIVVNGTVHGTTNFPSLLIVMSVAKDAERIGDYGKNLFDLAKVNPQMDAEERGQLNEVKDQISKLLVRAKNLYESEDRDSARVFLHESDAIQDVCDAGTTRAIAATNNAAAVALTFRYFKRIASHAANVVSSIVMPLDKLDFFDED